MKTLQLIAAILFLGIISAQTTEAQKRVKNSEVSLENEEKTAVVYFDPYTKSLDYIIENKVVVENWMLSNDSWSEMVYQASPCDTTKNSMTSTEKLKSTTI